MTNWNDEAAKVAQHTANDLHEAHRGALAWNNRIVIVFGNDGYESDETSSVAHEIATVRKVLSEMEPAPTELGFGLCGEGYTWVMLWRAQSDTDARKIAAAAHIAVWRGWREACETKYLSEGEWACIDAVCNVQYAIAQGVVDKVLQGQL